MQAQTNLQTIVRLDEEETRQVITLCVYAMKSRSKNVKYIAQKLGTTLAGKETFAKAVEQK